MSGGNGGNIFGAYGVVKALEPKISELADVHAAQAALDREDLQKLEGELYGAGAGPARDPDPIETDRVHLLHPHLLHPGR